MIQFPLIIFLHKPEAWVLEEEPLRLNLEEVENMMKEEKHVERKLHMENILYK